MHSAILQISASLLTHDRFIKHHNITPTRGIWIDYVNRLYGTAAVKEVESFVDCENVKPLLALAPDGNLIYKGGVEEWLENHLQDIQQACNEITVNDILDYPTSATMRLEDALTNPLDVSTLFIEGDNSNEAESSIALIRLLSRLEPGDKVYVGTVYDYHF